jgi:hypothetical protein
MMRSWFGAAAVAFATVLAGSAAAEEDLSYPIRFGSPAELEELGISLKFAKPDDNAWPKPTFANTCYGYDFVGNILSVSDEFLARYRAKGFTRESLCLGLISFARFDPETGKRLPTYMVIDEKAVEARFDAVSFDEMSEDRIGELTTEFEDESGKRKTTFKDKDAVRAAIKSLQDGEYAKVTEDQFWELLADNHGRISDELPLVVPDCFKNGTPYVDCAFRYSFITGKKLPEATTESCHTLGAALDAEVRANLKGKPNWAKEQASDPSNIAPYLGGMVYGVPPGEGKADADTPSAYEKFFEGCETATETGTGGHITFFVYSPDFPHGYMHVLNASGEKDAAVSVGSILSALGANKLTSQVNVGRLKKVLAE